MPAFKISPWFLVFCAKRLLLRLFSHRVAFATFCRGALLPPTLLVRTLVPVLGRKYEHRIARLS